MRSPGTRLSCFGTAQSSRKWRNNSHVSRRKNSQTIALKHSKNSKNTIRKMASAIQRISAKLNIPTCPYISLPGFKKTKLANILQFPSASSVLAFFIVLFVFVASFLGCFVVRDLCGSDCRPDYEQSLFFLCLSSKRARHTNDHARD